MGAEALATASEQDPGLSADSYKMPKRSSPSLLSAAHLEAMTECQSYASLPAYKQVRRLPTASSDFSLSDSDDDDDDETSSVLSSCGSSASEESLLSCASSRAVPDAGDHRELKPQEHSNDRYLSGDALSTHADAAIPAHVKRSLAQMPYPGDPGQLAQLNVPTTNDLDEALRSNGLLAYVPSRDIGLQKPAQHLVSFTEVLACTSVTSCVKSTSCLPMSRPAERFECGLFWCRASLPLQHCPQDSPGRILVAISSRGIRRWQAAPASCARRMAAALLLCNLAPTPKHHLAPLARLNPR